MIFFFHGGALPAKRKGGGGQERGKEEITNYTFLDAYGS